MTGFVSIRTRQMDSGIKSTTSGIAMCGLSLLPTEAANIKVILRLLTTASYFQYMLRIPTKLYIKIINEFN